MDVLSGEFDEALIEACARSAKENCGPHGFILIMVKSKEDQQLLCATNLVPEIAVPAMQHGAAFLNRLHLDALDVIGQMREQGKIPPLDAPRLGDGD